MVRGFANRRKSQTAMMILEPGKSSGDKEAHKKSDQVLLLLEGELGGEIGDEEATLKKGRRPFDSSWCKTPIHESRWQAGCYLQRLLSPGISGDYQGLVAHIAQKGCARLKRPGTLKLRAAGCGQSALRCH